MSSFTGQFTFTSAVVVNTSIQLDPRENEEFKKACAFASRVELVSAVGEFACGPKSTTGSYIVAGFIHHGVTLTELAVRTAPDAVMVFASKDLAIERQVVFKSNSFFGKELKGAVLGHEPPKFVVYPVGKPGETATATDKVLLARLTIVVRLLGDGSSGSE